MQISSLYLHLAFYKIIIFIKCGEIALLTLTLLTPPCTFETKLELPEFFKTDSGDLPRRCILLKITFYVPSTAVQLHFIQCPFPNRFRFGSEKKFHKIFWTELDSVWKEKTIFKPRKNSEPNPIRFEKKSSNILEIGSEKFAILSLPSKRLTCAKWTQYTS